VTIDYVTAGYFGKIALDSLRVSERFYFSYNFFQITATLCRFFDSENFQETGTESSLISKFLKIPKESL
jgi:hypothetical protein